MMIDSDKRLVDLLSYITADFGCSSYVTFTFTFSYLNASFAAFIVPLS